MVEPHSSNFRVITTNILGVRIFRKIYGMYLNVVLIVTFYTFVNLIFKLIGIALMCIEMISENAQYSFIKLFYITFWTHILWCKNFFFLVCYSYLDRCILLQHLDRCILLQHLDRCILLQHLDRCILLQHLRSSSRFCLNYMK